MEIVVTPNDPGTPSVPVETPPNQDGQPVKTGDGGADTTQYELPDGRKVSAEELAKEWKENFLPDYTRKSQELATLKKSPDGSQPQPTQTPLGQSPWADPNYIPKTWEEIFAEVDRRNADKLQAEQTKTLQAQQERAELDKQIDLAVSKIKETDKTLSEEDMFKYAAEKAKKGVQYGTVEALYEDYKMIETARLQGQRDAQRNMANRQQMGTTVGVSGPPGPQPTDLSQLPRGSITDAVQAHLQRLGNK